MRHEGDVMQVFLETLAFALLIGGQFLAAIVLMSRRASLYPDTNRAPVSKDLPQPSRHLLPGDSQSAKIA
jgi:hypothetical protein